MATETKRPEGRYASVEFYEMLFCDNLKLYLDNAPEPTAYPWNRFLEYPRSLKGLKEIIDDPNLECRIKLLAYYLLREQGVEIKKKEVLGIVVEVVLHKGTDVLAAYSDNKVRFMHHSGRITIWDKDDEITKSLISQLFAKCDEAIKRIGPWEHGRLAPPKPGHARVSFLLSDGLYFGQGENMFLFSDPIAVPTLTAALTLLEHITTGPPV